MKLVLLLALLFTVFAETNLSTELKKETPDDDDDGFLELTVRPEYVGYPYSRAKHPVIFVEDGNGENEIFNFCGHPDGFKIEDITDQCFWLPYTLSLNIPPVILSLVVLVTTCSACIYSCCRMCLGQCCFATTGCCCAEKPKQYTKKDWFGFLIATIIAICGLQLPFFITGITGNASMTVALNGMASEIMDVYPTLKDVVDNLLTTVESIDLQPLYDVFKEMEELENATNTEPSEEARKREIVPESFKMKANQLIQTIDSIETSRKRIDEKAMKLAMKQEASGDNDDDGGMMDDIKEAVQEVRDILKDVTDIADPVFDIIEMIINILIIVREVIFDIVLIMPFIGGVLMIVGAFLRIHQLSVSFFPCACYFSQIAIVFVAYEYPVSTIIADGCVVIYNVLEGAKQAEQTEIKSIADIQDFISNSTTKELINEALKVFVDCEKSLIGDIKGTVNSIVDDLIVTALGDINMTFFDGLFEVCDNPQPGIIFNYNGTVSLTVDDLDGQTRNYGKLDDRTCLDKYPDTECVYDLVQYALNENNSIIADPLLVCHTSQPTEAEKDVNILQKLKKLFKDMMDMAFVNQNVYWVNDDDFADITAQKVETGGDEIVLEDIMSNIGNLAGLMDPELLQQLFGGEVPDDINPDDYLNRKRDIEKAIKMSKLKRAGNKPIYCANLDGVKIDNNGNKMKNSTGGDDYVPEGYSFTNLACTPSNEIKLDNCRDECPNSIYDIVEVVEPILKVGDSLVSVFDKVEELLDAIADIADFVGCGTLGKIASDLPPTICETYLEAETTLVTGLIAYGIILWALYIYGLVAIKRFNYANYLPVEKDDKRYYNQGDIELE